LANLTVQLALNLRLEGIVAQRRARLARRANIGPPIRIDRGMKQGLVAVVALRPCAAQGLGQLMRLGEAIRFSRGISAIVKGADSLLPLAADAVHYDPLDPA
jgi:hypothetical protein